MDRQEILNRLMAFPYDRDEYWVITGSAMVMYGIKEPFNEVEESITHVQVSGNLIAENIGSYFLK